MDKNVKLRLIGRVSWNLEPFSPVTPYINPQTYLILSTKFSKFERWHETEKILREEFEELLKYSEDLIDAYLDVYAKKATFYKCIVSSETRHFQYFMMKSREGLAMLYYREVEIIDIS